MNLWALGTFVVCGAIACRHEPRDPPVVPSDMAWVTTTDDPLQWQAAGFIELTTPVRPPTTEDGTAHIVVELKLPEGTVLRLLGTDPLSFEIPVGTTAARVEYAGTAHAPDRPIEASWRILDVRQFDWTADGIDCTVLRPDGDQLVGLRWRCGEHADARAGELLATFARDGRFAGPRGMSGRERTAHRLRLVNDCRTCHQFGRAEDRRITALVQRGTDAVGLFSLSSVFRDEDPVERYRPVDTNAGDPTMIQVCPGTEIDVPSARCRDGLRPRLRIDVAQGMRDRSAHVMQLCATRRQLAARLDPPGRDAIRGALEDCGPE